MKKAERREEPSALWSSNVGWEDLSKEKRKKKPAEWSMLSAQRVLILMCPHVWFYGITYIND